MKSTIASLRARASELTPAELEALSRDPRAGVRLLAGAELRRRRASAVEEKRLQVMLAPERERWRQGDRLVAGVDEAGAGPWAGPVVAGAVILPRDTLICGVDDSKKLNRKQRELLVGEIRARAVAWAVGVCSAEEIDALNIKVATCLAMKRAVDALDPSPEHLLVDWREIPDVEMGQTRLVHGDQLSLSIAAASIIAKTHRDALMRELAALYPQYGFEDHVGYGTAAHHAALRVHGPCPIHRRSFKPVARILGLVPDKPRKRRSADAQVS